MDALEKGYCQAAIFENCNFLQLHCCDTRFPTTFRIHGLPVLTLKVFFCHCSFLNALSERRLCILPNCTHLQNKLQQINSPCVISVTSSAFFKFVPEEVEDEGPEEILIVWDFEVDVSLSATATALPPCYPENDEIEGLPLLDAEKTNCNCTDFANPKKVLLGLPSDNRQKQFRVPVDCESDEDLQSEDDHESDQDVLPQKSDDDISESDQQPEQELFTEFISMKGSSYHLNFQEALRKCKQHLINQDPLQLQLRPEPMNKRDENAIVVCVLLDSWTPIGYIPAAKVPKVTYALRNNEITNIKLNSVIYRFVFGIGEHRYFGGILVTKKNKWLPNKHDYEYNDAIL